MGEKPKSLEELIPYLVKHPRVNLRHYNNKDELIADEQRTFLKYDSNNGWSRLFFKNENGTVFTPLCCPLQSSMTMHLRFTKEKFSVLVLSLDGSQLSQFHYYYQD